MAVPRRDLLIGALQALGGLSVSPELAGARPSRASARTLLLLECHVAGTSYAALPPAYESALQVGQRLSLRREPENPVDRLAIQVQDPSGRKLGYLPRAKNEVLGRLMDAGVAAHAEVGGWERIDRWLKIEVRVFAELPV